MTSNPTPDRPVNDMRELYAVQHAITDAGGTLTPGVHKAIDALRGVWDAGLRQAQAEGHQYRTALQGVARRDAATPSVSAVDQTTRDRIAAAIWERQNPGRRWADCKYRWQADAEADADAVLAELRTPPAVPVSSPPPDQTALRDRIAEAVRETVTRIADLRSFDTQIADAVLAVLPPPADQAAILQWAADQIDAETRQLKADEVLEPEKFRPCRDASAQLRALAGCQECASGLEHNTHCPTPETHNWGCGCPSDVAAAIASCPGYETKGPSPCRCPCYGCKHHCGAHDPSWLAAEAQQPDTEPRPVQHAPGKAALCPDCRAKGHAVCMPDEQPPAHIGGVADDCPA